MIIEGTLNVFVKLNIQRRGDNVNAFCSYLINFSNFVQLLLLKFHYNYIIKIDLL